MTDREKLIDLLGEMQSIGIKESNVIFPGYTAYVKDYVRNDVIADHLIASGVTLQKWTPASEPPQELGDYIVMIKGAQEATTLWYHPDRGTWEDMDCDIPYAVTHWQPLPEPPGEGET